MEGNGQRNRVKNYYLQDLSTNTLTNTEKFGGIGDKSIGNLHIKNPGA